MDSGTDASNALKAQAAATPGPTTAAASDTVIAEEAKLLGTDQSSLAHPASPPQDPSAAGHQQPQQQQQQQQTETTLQDSIAPTERHIVGEELDDRVLAAVPVLQHTQADTTPLTAADPSVVHTHMPAGTLATRGIAGEEQESKATVAPWQPDTAVEPVHEPEQASISQLPKSAEPPAMAHASDHHSVVLMSQGSRSAHSQADQGQAGAMQEAQEDHGPRQGHCPDRHTGSRARSLHRHRREGHSREGNVKEAVDVEDGEMPSAVCDGNTEAVQKAADAVVGEELHPMAATPAAGTDALERSSGPAANRQHQALHGRALTKPNANAVFTGTHLFRGQPGSNAEVFGSWQDSDVEQTGCTVTDVVLAVCRVQI